METRKEFEEGYAKRSKMTVEKLHDFGFFAHPCDCADESCKGWQMCSNENWEFFKDIHNIKDEKEYEKKVRKYFEVK